jgi:cytochrome b561
MNSDISVKRYHPALAALHWLIAVTIMAPLVFSALDLANMPSAAPMKIGGLRVHMSVGALVGLLMLVRSFVRTGTRHPTPATTGSPVLDRVAWASHRLLYIAVFGQVASGLLLAWQADLPANVFWGYWSLPPDFRVFPVRAMHYVFSRLLMTMIGLHVLGAAYHTFIGRDGLLGRMLSGRRVR